MAIGYPTAADRVRRNVNKTAKTELVELFLRDHRQMTRMLSDVVSHLHRNELVPALTVAQKLDRVAGPHIQFEEQVLYPEVKSVRGKAFDERLRDEHQAARDGLTRFLTASELQLKDPGFLAMVEKKLRSGLKHAESCGTLVSHLEQFSTSQQQQALLQLSKLKRAGTSWTESVE